MKVPAWLVGVLALLLGVVGVQWFRTAQELPVLRAEAEAASYVADSLATLADRSSAVADSVAVALDSLETTHSRVVDSLRVARVQLRFERLRSTATVDSLLELVPDSLGLGLAIQAERAEWDAEVDILEEIVGDQRELLDDLRSAIEVERDAKLAERSGRLAAEQEAERWRALADAAESQIRRSRVVAGAAVVAGILIALFGM